MYDVQRRELHGNYAKEAIIYKQFHHSFEEERQKKNKRGFTETFLRLCELHQPLTRTKKLRVEKLYFHLCA